VTDNPEGEDSTPPEPAAAASAPADLPPAGLMLAKEQQTGYLVAGAIAVLVVVIGVWRQTHGRSGSLATAALGLAAAAAMAFASYRGRRMFAAIIAVVGGLALTSFFPLNFMFLFYGAYLMFKQSQAQKKLNKAGIRRQPRARADPSSRRGRGRAAPADNRPKANSRYTPPKRSKTTKRSR
jgi:hypothetical protein